LKYGSLAAWFAQLDADIICMQVCNVLLRPHRDRQTQKLGEKRQAASWIAAKKAAAPSIITWVCFKGDVFPVAGGEAA
jgi:hypothetical protein